MFLAALLAATAALLPAQAPVPFRFLILGDRTGETADGVYQQAWREISALKPAFVVSVGDSIQGVDDATAEKQWIEFERLIDPFRSLPFYPAAGNHDIWSAGSARLFEKYTGHPPHYGFDNGPVHVTVLNNSESDALPASEITFLESDLKAHQAQPVKLIVSHRPSWLLNVMLRSPDFPLQRLAVQYGVHTVVAGHIHQLIHGKLGDVDYISAPSAGGHLRDSAKYEEGWFFGWILATVNGSNVTFEVHELAPPNGKARVTSIADWGVAGLSGR